MTCDTGPQGTLGAARSSYTCEPHPAHREQAARRADLTTAAAHHHCEEASA